MRTETNALINDEFSKKNMQTIVVSVGGSLIAPTVINWEYVSTFCSFIQERSNVRWIIVVGGGGVARSLIPHIADNTQKDLVGISVTRMNAQVLISQLPDACPNVLVDTQLPEGFLVYVAGGFTPGRTTDDVAVQFALAHGADCVINLTNVDGVLVDGVVKAEMTYEEFSGMFPDHVPGINAPFDPVATRRAQDAGLPVYIVSGKEFSALKNVLEKKPFVGTVLC